MPFHVNGMPVPVIPVPMPCLISFYFITPHHLFFIIIAHLRINSNQFSIILNEISSSSPYLVTKRCAPGSKKYVICMYMEFGRIQMKKGKKGDYSDDDDDSRTDEVRKERTLI